MKKLILLGLLICVVMAAPVAATITIFDEHLYTDGRYPTYQAWSFTTPPPPASSLGATGIPADPTPIRLSPGTPTADVALTIGAGQPPPGWYDNLGDNHQGLIFGNTATIDLHIPNVVDPRYEKIIQAEVIYYVMTYEEGVHGYIDAASYVAAGDKTYESVSVNDTALQGGWRDVTIEWRIPQIYPVEVVHLYLVNTGVAVDRIEVATICVPEPATLLLLGGATLVGWLRRRRTI